MNCNRQVPRWRRFVMLGFRANAAVAKAVAMVATHIHPKSFDHDASELILIFHTLITIIMCIYLQYADNTHKKVCE